MNKTQNKSITFVEVLKQDKIVHYKFYNYVKEGFSIQKKNS